MAPFRAVADLVRRARRSSRMAHASGQYWDTGHDGSADVRHWLEVRAIVEKVNERITDDRGTYPLTAFLHAVGEHTPVPRALSIGCGVGHLEREVVRQKGALHVDGVDTSARSIRLARSSAEEAGLGSTLHYHRTDILGWLRRHRGTPYDLVFANGVLHHVVDLEELLELCADCVREGSPGWVFVDEYVGPSRDEWTDAHLEPARRLYAEVPAEHRRTEALWPPIAWEDPTEMIRSSEIVPLLHEHFEVVHERPYYGNVLHPLVCAIKGQSLSEPVIEDLIDRAIRLEDELIEAGELEPFFAAFALRAK